MEEFFGLISMFWEEFVQKPYFPDDNPDEDHE